MEPASTDRYPFRQQEPYWQQRWAEADIFHAEETPKRPYYVLEMFPYPSGAIHMGHVRNYTLGDVLARYKRACGFDVLHPMGWDAFGLPAENAAIERAVHPGEWTRQNIKAMRKELKSIGLSYDWSRELATCEPEYYQHEQRFFLKMLEKGLAYRKESSVNWDPVDHTVLANEQVVDGRGWRSGALVERRTLSQWFLRITDYAEDLLQGLATLDQWPEKVRLMQERWIGKSEGALVHLPVDGGDAVIDVYTTRPETLYGMSFCGIAAEHPLARDVAQKRTDVAVFIKECAALGTAQEAIDTAEKRGIDTGLRVRHPFTGALYPVYICNFVLMDYGTGAIFACPAHDPRDFAFAQAYNLPITPVVAPVEGLSEPLAEAYEGDGVMIHSDFMNGLPIQQARTLAIDTLQQRGAGERRTQYRLRDWGVSRQRYWGCPIPIIHCKDCGVVPVPEADLPVKLPDDVEFDTPGNPLARHPEWKHVPCPVCGKPAERETDTFDTFFESSWYFARFASAHAPEGIDKAIAAPYLPVDCYIGGIEHAVLHLLYARFFTRALYACDIMPIQEPFKQLMTQGMIAHETYKDASGQWLYPEEVVKEGDVARHVETGAPVQVGRSEKMSKSKRNTIAPRDILARYGADTARLFMMSDSPPERDLEWTDSGAEGAWRYLNRVWRLVHQHADAVSEVGVAYADENTSLELRRKAHTTIAGVSRDIEQFHYNKAIARIRELSNAIVALGDTVDAALRPALREALCVLVQLLAPFTPHMAEALWEKLGNTGFVALAPWPVADPALLVQESITIAVQVNGKLRATLEVAKDTDNKTLEAEALAHESVQSYVEGKTIRKIVVVPGRIVNIVVA